MSDLSRPLRILVVDDNQDNTYTLALLLKAMGHEVNMALDGHSAIRLSAEFPPDLILLDIAMPRLSGFSVCRAVRETIICKQVVIVAHTAYEPDFLSENLTGFDGYLAKPIKPKSLAECIRGARTHAGLSH